MTSCSGARDQTEADIDAIPGESLLSDCTNNLHDSCDNIIQKVYFQNKAINHITVGNLKMKVEVVSRSMANCMLTLYQQGKSFMSLLGQSVPSQYNLSENKLA